MVLHCMTPDSTPADLPPVAPLGLCLTESPEVTTSSARAVLFPWLHDGWMSGTVTRSSSLRAWFLERCLVSVLGEKTIDLLLHASSQGTACRWGSLCPVR